MEPVVCVILALTLRRDVCVHHSLLALSRADIVAADGSALSRGELRTVDDVASTARDRELLESRSRRPRSCRTSSRRPRSWTRKDQSTLAFSSVPHRVVSGSCSHTWGLAGVDAPALICVLDSILLVAGVLRALELGRGSARWEVARAFAEIGRAVAGGAVGLVRDDHVRGDRHQVR